MNPYCTAGQVTDLVLKEVTAAAEGLNPELVERTIGLVTEEVASLLARRYPLWGVNSTSLGSGRRATADSKFVGIKPPLAVPAIVSWITAAISAWRVVGAITSLMDTEAGSDNQWLPIQKQYERAWKLLEDLAAGKLKLNLGEEPDDPDREVVHAAVVTPGNYFDLSKF